MKLQPVKAVTATPLYRIAVYDKRAAYSISPGTTRQGQDGISERAGSGPSIPTSSI
jgi:hypothetical protein